MAKNLHIDKQTEEEQREEAQRVEIDPITQEEKLIPAKIATDKLPSTVSFMQFVKYAGPR